MIKYELEFRDFVLKTVYFDLGFVCKVAHFLHIRKTREINTFQSEKRRYLKRFCQIKVKSHLKLR